MSLLETSDIGHVSTYNLTRNGDFRKLPPKLKISLPSFQPQNIDAERASQKKSVQKDDQDFPLYSSGYDANYLYK